MWNRYVQNMITMSEIYENLRIRDLSRMFENVWYQIQARHDTSKIVHSSQKIKSFYRHLVFIVSWIIGSSRYQKYMIQLRWDLLNEHCEEFVIFLFVRKRVERFIMTIFFSVQWSYHDVEIPKKIAFRVIDISCPATSLRIIICWKRLTSWNSCFRNYQSELDRRLKIFKWLKVFIRF